jgi:hypothetical protein
MAGELYDGKTPMDPKWQAAEGGWVVAFDATEAVDEGAG